ncbi:MAG: glycosyltransferase, partial [Verrucomicrobiia bacterium]
MHTLLIHQAFCIPGEPGGTRHFELAKHAVADGQRFTIIASRVSYLTGKTVDPKADAEWAKQGVTVTRTYSPERVCRGLAWRAWSFLVFTASSLWGALRVGRVDVVMGTTPPIFQTISSWLVARLRRVPFLLEVRDLWPEFAVDMGLLRNRALIALARWFERWL